jgi:hypothetical protein
LSQALSRARAVPLAEERYNSAIERQRAYEAIAATYQDWGFDKLGWTAEVIAETEQRLAIDDADLWDSSAHFADFALQVLDRLGVVEPYDGPGDYRPRFVKPS